MILKLLKAIVALTSTALMAAVVFGLGYWCCEAAATCVRCQVHRPAVYVTMAACAFIAVVLVFTTWLVLTLDRHFEDNKRLAARAASKSIGPDYGDDSRHSHGAP